jgi:hypothetical protein
MPAAPNMLAPVAQGLAKLSSELNNIENESRKLREASELSRAKAGAGAELQQLSFDLQNGVIQEDGTVTPPPDPNGRLSQFQTQTTEILSRYGANLSDESKTKLESDVLKLSVTHGLEIQKQIIDLNAQQAVVNLDVTLDTLAALAVEAPEVVKPQLLKMAELAITQQRGAGVLDPTVANRKREKFLHLIDTAEIRRLVRVDPDQALLELTKTKLQGFTPDEQERWTTLALNASERQRKVKLAERTAARVELDRAQTVLKNQTFKDGVKLLVQGALTPEWVLNQETNLSKTDFNSLLTQASKEVQITSSRDAYAKLRVLAGKGVDNTSEAKQAFLAESITGDQFNSILSEIETNAPGAQVPSWYKRGSQYIIGQIGGENANPFELKVQSRVLDDWAEWVDAHPNASDREAREVYRQYAEDGTLVSTATIDLPVPTYLTGGRSSPGLTESWAQAEPILKDTWTQTKKALASGDIDDFEYNRQAELLRDWTTRIQNQFKARGK